jgi:transposase
MQFTHILGIDVSKKTIDAALSENRANAVMANQQFANSLKGYKELQTWVKQQKASMKNVLVCLENTGIYNRYLVCFLQAQNATVWVETPVQIKWSQGLQRGKNDKADAQRICLYAFRNQDKRRPYAALDKSLQQVADLLGTRQRLINARKMLLIPIKELKAAGLKEEAKVVEKACQKSIAALEKEMETIEKQLEQVIQQDEQLNHTYTIVRSVRCIGLVAALHLMVYTHNFQRFDNAKQVASYSGVAPFEYSSGTSVRGKTKVHNMANKTLKTILHMCAVSSVRHNPEMRQYMERKVAEGKNKMSILNAIRNKILHRVFACVREQRPYEMRAVV